MHKARGILNTIAAKLAPLETNGHVSNIEPSNAQPSDIFPNLVYSMGSETVERKITQNIQDRTLNINIDIFVDSKDTDIDAKFLAVREQVELALMADFTLSLPYVTEIQYEGQEVPSYFGDATTYAGGLRLNFSVKYRTDANNPSV